LPDGRRPRGLLRPGSHGEHTLQERRGTTQQAGQFYGGQVTDRLAPKRAVLHAGIGRLGLSGGRRAP
jgi:hypothetical protein